MVAAVALIGSIASQAVAEVALAMLEVF